MNERNKTERNRKSPDRYCARSEALDRSINGLFREAVRLNLGNPGRAVFFMKAALHQRSAVARRRKWAARGVRVPPLMILNVSGLYDSPRSGSNTPAQKGSGPSGPMDEQELRRLLRQARDLGVSVIVLAGGEPLARPEILDLVADCPEIVFVMVTSGSLIDGSVLDRLEQLRNLIPVISLGGFAAETESRTDDGVCAEALNGMKQMRRRRLFFGTSVMVTRSNFPLVTSRIFVRELVARGSRIFLYTDYVSIRPDTAHLAPSSTQRSSEALSMSLFRAEFPGIFLAPDSSEQVPGSCPTPGNGFVRVDPDGRLAPCLSGRPSDVNVREASLREALASELRCGRGSDGERPPERLVA